MSFNYAKAELRKLESGDVYRLKITSDTGGETRWLTISRATLDNIATVLILADKSGMDMERARKLDTTVREWAGKTPFTFDPDKEAAPVGSEAWHSFMGDVLAASHNMRVMPMDVRNDLMQELYVVWTGDTSSDPYGPQTHDVLLSGGIGWRTVKALTFDTVTVNGAAGHETYPRKMVREVLKRKHAATSE